MKNPEEIKRMLVTCLELNMPPDVQHMAMADALALIKQLEAQVPRWIPVEERPPKEFATVIIWRNDCKNATIGWFIGGYWSVPKGVRVTHWMPLPEGPKEDAHDLQDLTQGNRREVWFGGSDSYDRWPRLFVAQHVPGRKRAPDDV